MPKYVEKDDIPAYKKRSKGTVTKKSTHKHVYADGILLLNDKQRLANGLYVNKGKKRVLCEYCTVCGKLGRTYDWLELMCIYSKNEEIQRKLKDTTLRVFVCDTDYAYKLKKVDLGRKEDD